MPLRSDSPTPGDSSHPAAPGDVHTGSVDAAPSSPATTSRGLNYPDRWHGDDN